MAYFFGQNSEKFKSLNEHVQLKITKAFKGKSGKSVDKLKKLAGSLLVEKLVKENPDVYAYYLK